MQRTLFSILLIACLCSGIPVHAQQKIAYVDISAIMKALPESQEAQRQLDVQVEIWSKELESLQKEWQTKYNDYDKRKLILTEQGRVGAEKELQELDRKIKSYQDQKFGQNGELFKLEDQLMKPIQDLVYEQVKLLGVELGYDYVLDKSGGVMIIYAKETHDLTKKAIERIEKTLPPRQAPTQKDQPGVDRRGDPGVQAPMPGDLQPPHDPKAGEVPGQVNPGK
jgi:outer membrane protein